MVRRGGAEGGGEGAPGDGRGGVGVREGGASEMLYLSIL